MNAPTSGTRAPRRQTLDDRIVYRVCPIDPHAHLFALTLAIPRPASAQRLTLPVWIPGSYLVREFARHVVRIEAHDGRGRAVRLHKIDKHTWEAAPCEGPLEVRYQVYAWDLSVRGAHLDASHAFFNGTSVFLAVVGRENEACDVILEPPPAPLGEGWRVATTLPRADAKPHGFGRYRAADYDELVDHPVEMGTFTLTHFEAAGARHEIAITGRHDADTERLVRDLRKVCALQARLFEPSGGRAPFDRYLFQVMAVGEGYGGLEHRASTALIARRDDLPWAGMKGTPEGYRRFLGLCSHEYFHAWHVKRIKPQVFTHHEFGHESYTRLLWIFEGFTSYYDDLMLVRAGVIEVTDYLSSLAATISQVLRTPGRRVQSVADSSFDAWIKYYRQDENAPNTIVSYYTKGALVALALDLSLRARSQGRRSLDDVMRLLWTRYGRGFYGPDGRISSQAGGLDERGFAELVREATGIAVDSWLKDWVEGTNELPLARVLKWVGVQLKLNASDNGAAALGVRLSESDGRTRISHVLNGGAAHAAGLSAGDELLAVDGLRADTKSLKARLARCKAGSQLQVHAFRRDELITTQIQLGIPPATEAKLSLDARPPVAAARLRSGWLGDRR